MGMQYDVKAAHINVNGVMVGYRTRVKGLIVTATTSAGYLYLWDSTTAPVAATYGRNSAGLVTVTQVAHGLQTGQSVGLVFGAGTGGQATTGNYVVTRLTADTYTVQDLNAGAITAGAAALKGNSWMISIDIGANESVSMPVPGEGVLAQTGIYATISNLDGVTVFYG
jgi:hypothetical protein